MSKSRDVSRLRCSAGQILDLCDRIDKGERLTTAAEKLGMSYATLQYKLKAFEDGIELRNFGPRPPFDPDKYLTWAEQIYLCVFLCQPESLARLMPEDAEETLEYIIGHRLTEREAKVLRMRFKDEADLEKTGSAFNVTRERIRQIEAKAIRKLRIPRTQYALRHGLLAAKTAEAMYETEKQERIRNLIERRLRSDPDIIRILREQEIEPAAPAVAEKEAETPIEELGLSTRAFHYLKRAGNNTLGDILRREEYELLQIRRFGKKCLSETVEMVHSRGQKMKWE